MARREYPEFPWFCIVLLVFSFAGGFYNTFTSTPFNLNPIMGTLFGFGGFMLVIAIIEIKKRSDAQRIVKTALDAQKKGRIPVEDFAEEVEMRPRSTRRVITDLRTKGVTDAHFDPRSGEIVIGKELDKKAEAPAQKQPNYCPYCGSRLPPAAKFCVNCGANIQRPEPE